MNKRYIYKIILTKDDKEYILVSRGRFYGFVLNDKIRETDEQFFYPDTIKTDRIKEIISSNNNIKVVQYEDLFCDAITPIGIYKRKYSLNMQ